MKGRGQAAIEFIVVLSLVIGVFLVIIYSMGKSHKELSQEIWSMEAQKVVNHFGDTIDRVYHSGSGTRESFILPSFLPGGTNYTLTVYPQLVNLYVPTYNREFNRKVLTRRINGTLDGLEVKKGWVLVKNRNESIYIYQGEK